MTNVFFIKNKHTPRRDNLIDFLRGGAMILVLLHHCGFPLGKFILAFHMPLFFVISGYLNNHIKGYERPFKPYIKAKFKRLLIPYFAFEILNLLIWCAKMIVEHKALPGIESITSILTCINNNYMGLYGRLWFLPCIFVADIYVWIIVNHFRKKFSLILSVLFLFALSFITVKIIPFRLPFTLDTALFAAAFILLGYCFSDIIKILLNKGNIAQKILLAIGALLYLLYSVLYTDVSVYMYINSYGEYTVSICAAICGCIAFLILGSYIYILISKLRIINDFVLWYGKNSLATFPVHLTIKMFLIWYFPSLSIWYTMFLIMLLLNIPIVNVITFYFPFILGCKYKNKTMV